MEFGKYARQLREQRYEVNRHYSIRQLARRIGMEPTYLSKIERGKVLPSSEEVILRLAVELGEDADLLLARADKIASDLHQIITRRPILFAELIRGLGQMSDEELIRLVHKVRDSECLAIGQLDDELQEQTLD